MAILLYKGLPSKWFIIQSNTKLLRHPLISMNLRMDMDISPSNGLLRFNWLQDDKIYAAKITVMNPNPTLRLFKVKTTSPMVFSVKPNKGAIKSFSCVDIVIKSHENPANHSKNRFLLQTKQLQDIPMDMGQLFPGAWEFLPLGSSMQLKIESGSPLEASTFQSSEYSGVGVMRPFSNEGGIGEINWESGGIIKGFLEKHQILSGFLVMMTLLGVAGLAFSLRIEQPPSLSGIEW